LALISSIASVSPRVIASPDCAGQSRHLSDLDWIRRETLRGSKQDNRGAGNQRAHREPIMPQQACSHQLSPLRVFPAVDVGKSTEIIMAK